VNFIVSMLAVSESTAKEHFTSGNFVLSITSEVSSDTSAFTIKALGPFIIPASILFELTLVYKYFVFLLDPFGLGSAKSTLE